MRTAWFASSMVASLLPLVLTGCAVPQPTRAPEPVASALSRGDQAFSLVQLPEVDAKVLFQLPPELEARIQQERLRTVSHQRGWSRCWTWSSVRIGAASATGPSAPSTAAQTWAAHRGDCLSLTILTYAAARAMGLNARMQEVSVPAVHERRTAVDFVNRHVDPAVRLRNDTLHDMLRTRAAIVDFEPQLTGGELGRPLDESDMLARFHNNLGGQALAAGDVARAYGHYRAAIAADPRYGAAHSNAAVLVEQRGLVEEAEVLLRHAVALSPEPEVALATLHRLLVAQHRQGEAEVVARRLNASREADPYHWISLGLNELDEATTVRRWPRWNMLSV